MIASWKKGYRPKIKAAVAANELEKIKVENGGVLTAGITLEKAKSAKSPIHKAFEWNNKTAGEEYRLLQARKLIGSLEVVYEELPNAPPTRHYNIVTDIKHDRKVYRTTKEILKSPVMRDELLGNAIRDAIAFRRRYAQLSELTSVFNALDSFVRDVKSA